MQMHAPQNYSLLRFQQLLCYDLTDLHDRVFHLHWDFPNACDHLSLHPIHYRPAAEAARRNYRFDYDSWALSWAG